MTKPSSDHGSIPQTLVGVSFDTFFRAQEFLIAANGLSAANDMNLKDAVIVVKDNFDRTVVHETIDPPLGQSALTGAVWAGLFGLILGGPVGWIAGLAVGAGTGAVTAKLVDLGISDEWVAWFKDAVRPGSVCVVLLIEDVDRDALVQEASRFPGAELIYANLDDATIEQVKHALEPSTAV